MSIIQPYVITYGESDRRIRNTEGRAAQRRGVHPTHWSPPPLTADALATADEPLIGAAHAEHVRVIELRR